MSLAPKELIYQEMIEKLQIAIHQTLEKGKIAADVKSWIEKTSESVNNDLSKLIHENMTPKENEKE